MNPFRVHAEYPAVFELIPHTGTAETLVQLVDRFAGRHFHATALPIMRAEIPLYFVNIAEADVEMPRFGGHTVPRGFEDDALRQRS